MNGRMYDPILGRMLSPDNFVQDPFFTQNFNRFSYVVNNPLKFTDPSENLAFLPILIGAIIGATTNAILNHQAGDGFFDITGDILAGAIGGAIGGALVATGGLGGNVLFQGLLAGSVTGTINVFSEIVQGETDLGNLITVFKNGLISGIIATTVSALVVSQVDPFIVNSEQIFSDLGLVPNPSSTSQSTTKFLTTIVKDASISGGIKVINSGNNIDNIGDVLKIFSTEFAISIPFSFIDIPSPLKSGLKTFTRDIFSGNNFNKSFFNAGINALQKGFTDEAIRLGISSFGIPNPPTYTLNR